MSRLKSIFRNLRLILSSEITAQIGEAETRLNQRADHYEQAVDARIEERFGDVKVQVDERFDDLEKHSDERAGNYESSLDQRVDERLAAIELRIDERLANSDSRIEDRLTSTEKRIDERFEDRSRATDNRLDDRLAKLERHIDERFGVLDTRTDERMESHERKTDAMIRQFSNDIVERNDVMLQIFEQRLDQQRRDLKQLRESGQMKSADAQAQTETDEDSAQETDESHSQLISFRKLANIASHAQTKIKQSGEAPLYHQILEWKKVAHEGMDNFTPDEKEVADYILSFVDDPKELHYVRQHLRRFVSTLQRIPPAQRNTDKLLELGSLSHIAPAIKKYCGYNEVHCADFWNSDEEVAQETVSQKTFQNGKPESHSFELRNFNVERDRFPYPDGHFHVVLCCELIEHLQSDPMHMLWECNRVLETDGWLLLTTPNIASCRAIEGLLVGCAPYLLAQYNVSETVDQHNREYAPYEIGVALSAAGFTVIELETEDVWSRSNPAILDLLKQIHIGTELRGDNIFALARKTGAPVERHPKELYID